MHHSDSPPPRVLGCYPAAADPLAPFDGPTLVAICGAHGNEPAGVDAATAVLAALRATRPSGRGRFIALVGNRPALVRGVRYVDTDLNRLWTDERVGELATRLGRDGFAQGADERDVARPSTDALSGDGVAARGGDGAGAAGAVEWAEQDELAEQVELFAAIARIAGAAPALHDPPNGPRTNVSFLDLHTTSAPSTPFAIALPTDRNRRLLAGVPLPLVHGLEGRLTGTLTGWLARRGHGALSVEGGPHDDPSSATHLAHALWLVLANSGVLDRRTAGWATHVAALDAARTGRPPGLTVAYRHPVRRGEGFRMRPGLASFQAVRKGAVLAETNAGPVRAPLSGLLLFPLYQALGDDGFFIARRIETRWPHGVPLQEGPG